MCYIIIKIRLAQTSQQNIAKNTPHIIGFHCAISLFVPDLVHKRNSIHLIRGKFFME